MINFDRQAPDIVTIDIIEDPEIQGSSCTSYINRVDMIWIEGTPVNILIINLKLEITCITRSKVIAVHPCIYSI